MPPILVIDDDGPTRAACKALLRRDRAGGTSSRLQGGASTRCDVMIADICMLDTDSTARIHALMQGPPTARLVARSQGGVMAPIHDAPDFQAMADRLAAK